MRRILEPNGSQPPIEAQSRINRFPPSSELSPSIAHTSEVAEFNRLSYSQLYSQDDSNLTIPSLLTMSTSMNLSPASSSSANIRGNGASILQSLNRNSISTNADPNLYRSVSIHSPPPDISISRSRSRSRDDVSLSNPQISPLMKRGRANHQKGETGEKTLNDEIKRKVIFSEIGRKARKQNDSMVYLEGPRIYTCGECRTHLTSHDEIISKSFHGMHGRAYLFDQCVNIMTGPAEDRRLITGLHSVCDISCKRCKTVIGWTYSKAYEQSQKYKEGKFIIEKIYLHMEESDCYNIDLPAMEKRDRWRIRAMSWSSDHSMNSSPRSRDGSTVYEYRARSASFRSPKTRSSSISTAGVSSIGSPPLIPAFTRALSPPEL